MTQWNSGATRDAYIIRTLSSGAARDAYLWTLTEARVVVGDFRKKYNEIRPHSRLGYESPARFTARSSPFPAPVGLRPPSAGNGQSNNENINSNQCSD